MTNNLVNEKENNRINKKYRIKIPKFETETIW